MKNYNYKCIVAKNGTKKYYKKISKKWKRISNSLGKKAEKGKKTYNFADINQAFLWYKGVGTNYRDNFAILSNYLRCSNGHPTINDIATNRDCDWPIRFLIALALSNTLNINIKNTLDRVLDENDTLYLQDACDRIMNLIINKRIINEETDITLDSTDVDFQLRSWNLFDAIIAEQEQGSGIIEWIFTYQDQLLNILSRILDDICVRMSNSMETIAAGTPLQVVWRGSLRDINEINNNAQSGNWTFTKLNFVSTSPNFHIADDDFSTGGEPPFKIILRPGMKVYRFPTHIGEEPEILIDSGHTFNIVSDEGEYEFPANDQDGNPIYEGHWFRLE